MINSTFNNKRNSFRKYHTFLIAAFWAALLFSPNYVAAGCSPYIGQASFNEFFKDQSNQSTDDDDFAEVKILNDAISVSTFQSWKIKICEKKFGNNQNNSGDGCSGFIPLSDFTDITAADPTDPDITKPWLVLRDGVIGKYINTKTGFDAVLVDVSGFLIDYVRVDGHTTAYDSLTGTGCSLSNLVFPYDAGAPGASDKSLHRNPDGTGDWEKTTSGADDGTSDDTNDEPPPGGDPLPKVTVTNVTVIKGQTATFIFTLENTVNYAVSVDYTTTGGTAVADTDPPVNFDYNYKTGTVTFPANTATLTKTVDISTNLVNPSTTGSVFFNLYLSNQQNAIIENHYPIGTILANQIADWQMDEVAWNGTSNEVIDVTSSNYHGTAINGSTTNSVTPALAGNPGTCNYGEFDGSNDYIALTGFPNLTGSFTIAAWINADEIGKDQRIFVDDENNSGGYAFSLGDGGNGELRFFSRDVSPVILDSGAVITANTWYHVAAVHDVSAKTRQLFVNGTAVTSAQIYTGVWGTDSGTASIGGETNSAGSEANSNWRFNGSIDEVRVYTDALTAEQITSIMNETHTCPMVSSPDHYSISHSGTGVTCKSEQITITAHDSSHAVMDPGTRTITLLTGSNRGTWSSVVTGGGTLTDATAGDGAATYTFPGGENSVVLTFDYTNPIADPDTISFNVTDGSNTETSGSATAAEDPDISFSKTGFIFNNETDGNTTIPTQLSGKSSDTDYNAKTITLQAVRQSDSDPAQCIAAFQNKTLNINFAAECKNPSSCVTGQLFNLTSGTVNGDLTATTNDNSAPGSSSYDTRSITFDANGEVDIIFNYPESGAIELHAQHNILLADGTTPSGNYMSGSSSFVVRPLALALSNLSYATDANGTVFTQAGEDFVTTFTAVRWQAADDANDDGISDTGANLSDNTITTNFGNENTPVVPSNISTSLPTVTFVTNAGTLTNSANSASFTNGVGTKTYNWSEVGIFNLTTTLSNYLSSGDDIIGAAQNVGRFIPHHFETAVTHACNSFTYSGQPFIATVYARNKANTTTLNYRDTFAHGVTLTDANPAGTPTGIFANNTITTTSFSSNSANNGAIFGVGSTEVANNFTYTFTMKETIPDTMEIRATDSNDTAISSNGFTEDLTEIRSGRTNVENSFGSELVDMSVIAHVEFYNTNGFEINTADTCSAVDVILTDIGTDPIALGAGAGQICLWDDAGDSVGGTDFTCTAVAGKPQFSEPASSGNFNINLKAPGADITGDIDVTLTSPSWLKYDWDGDGTDDDDPTGTASFGLYRGDDRVIYWREVF